MYWRLNPYAMAMLMTMAISGGLVFYMWRRRSARGAIPLALMMLSVAGWSFGYALELGSPSLSAKIFWTNFNFIGIVIAPVAWFIFVLEYTYRDHWLTRRNVTLLFIPSLVTLVLSSTNGTHGLIRSAVKLDVAGLIPMLDPTYGAGFWVFWFYAFLLTFSASFLMVYTLVKAPGLYQGQVVALLVVASVPWISNILYLSGLSPFHKLDLTPFSFTLMVAVMAWNLSRYKLLDIVPVARDAIIESMRDGVVVLDGLGRIVDVNPTARQLIHTEISNLIGQPAAQVLPDWGDLLASNTKISEMQTEILLGEGTAPRHFDLIISPLYDRQGALTGRSIVLRDITERKQTEEMLRLRTAELEARNEELDAFAHTVAHDLKSPLTSIVGFSGVLEKRLGRMSDEEIVYYLGIIGRSGRKMSNIIDELLLLARIRKLEDVRRAPLEMADIVAEALERLMDISEDRRAEIILPPMWPVALGHGPWVEEIWVNYISNALKYGGMPPYVELGATIAPNGDTASVRFWVRDNGQGLTPEEQARLFTLFTRLEGVRAKGHGLGLSIVRRIVEKLDGEAGVESDVGAGSTFWFTLPSP
jgi:PAS domain S-box-containing protein